MVVGCGLTYRHHPSLESSRAGTQLDNEGGSSGSFLLKNENSANLTAPVWYNMHRRQESISAATEREGHDGN